MDGSLELIEAADTPSPKTPKISLSLSGKLSVIPEVLSFDEYLKIEQRSPTSNKSPRYSTNQTVRQRVQDSEQQILEMEEAGIWSAITTMRREMSQLHKEVASVKKEQEKHIDGLGSLIKGITKQLTTAVKESEERQATEIARIAESAKSQFIQREELVKQITDDVMQKVSDDKAKTNTIISAIQKAEALNRELNESLATLAVRVAVVEKMCNATSKANLGSSSHRSLSVNGRHEYQNLSLASSVRGMLPMSARATMPSQSIAPQPYLSVSGSMSVPLPGSMSVPPPGLLSVPPKGSLSVMSPRCNSPGGCSPLPRRMVSLLPYASQPNLEVLPRQQRTSRPLMITRATGSIAWPLGVKQPAQTLSWNTVDPTAEEESLSL